MKPDPGHADTAALRDYVEAVAELLRVEPAASWSEHGSPSTAYIALADRSPRHAGRLLMLQWAADAGWCLALEPEAAEEPTVLVRWPEPRRPRPAVVARRVRAALTELARPEKNTARCGHPSG
ncbi:DUF6292 family protein [Amycolatopsis australiensis]|uniref:DUF6292 domain-containing protein n=1 Tax=Amycolatopsis australiensis TaxID=546364 RepID=A0A1K1SNU2_9PSEU|nr:DUF6292 family protein [Amycolatopsis australiensis]SFW85884.1 hypothetical protein SAMN04489730_6244 [Amycolatopsis australiensis]